MPEQTNTDFIISLNLGSNFIRLAIMEPKEREKSPHVLGFSEIESQGIRNGNIVHFEAVVKNIQEAIDDINRQTGITVESAHVVLGNSQTISDNITETIPIKNQDIKPSDLEKLHAAVKSKEVNPEYEPVHIIPTQYIVDGKVGIISPCGLYGNQLSCVYHRIMLPKNDLKNILRACNEAGIHVESFISESFAAAYAALQTDDQELGAICISLGSNNTHVCIFSGGYPIFNKCYPFGSYHLTKDLAVGLRTTRVIAEKIKKNFANVYEVPVERNTVIELPDLPTSVTVRDIQLITKPRIIEILETIKTDLLKLNLVSNASKGVVLTGGGALLNGLCSVTEEVFELPSRIGFPKEVTGIIDNIRTPATTATLGVFPVVYSSSDKSAEQANRAGASRGEKSIRAFASSLWNKIIEPFDN